MPKITVLPDPPDHPVNTPLDIDIPAAPPSMPDGTIVVLWVAYQANANGKVSLSRDFAQKTSISLKDLRNSQPKFTPTVRGFYTVNLVGLTKQGNVKKAVRFKSPPIRVV